MIYGLGKAILAGTKAYGDEKDHQLLEEKTKQQMAKDALDMALMKEKNDREAQQAKLTTDTSTLALAHNLASSFDDMSLVPNSVGDRFKGTVGETFFTPDKTLDSKPMMGLGGLIGSQPISLPTSTASPGVETGNGYRSHLPIDSKGALAQQRALVDYYKAASTAGTAADNRAAQDARNRDDNFTKFLVANLAKNGRDAALESRMNNLTLSQKMNEERNLAQEWQKAIAPYNTRKDSLNQMKLALQNMKDAERWGAPGQAIIVNFNKLLDPHSVVRESEYARTPENSPAVDRFLGLYDRITKGGAGVRPDELAQYVDLAEKIIGSSTSGLSALRRRIDESANTYGLNRANIYGEIPDANFGVAPVPGQGGGGLVVRPDGTVGRGR